jgi:hypothetical protein
VHAGLFRAQGDGDRLDGALPGHGEYYGADPQGGFPARTLPATGPLWSSAVILVSVTAPWLMPFPRIPAFPQAGACEAFRAREPVTRIELVTCRLQDGCSAN